MTASPTFGLEVEGHLRELAPGIVDEHIQTAPVAPDVGDKARAAFVIADIESLRIDRHSKTLQEGLGFGQPLLAASQNGEICAQPRAQRGDRKAEAAARAGDNNDLPLEEVGPIDRRPAAQLFIR